MRRLAALVSLTTLLFVPLSSRAVHFFNGCGPGDLTETPAAASVGQVAVGDVTFSDSVTGEAVTTVPAGESVTFTFLSPYCHSVTFSGGGIAGTDLGTTAPGLAERTVVTEVVTDPDTGDQVTITKVLDSQTVSFPEPGAFSYYCKHHWPLGMRGVVVVTP